MKRKKLILFALLPLIASMAYCQSHAKMKFRVKVVDDLGRPIQECTAKTTIFVKHFAGEGFGRDGYQSIPEKTNEEGIAQFNVRSSHSRISYGATPPDGYYPYFGEEFFFKYRSFGVWKPSDKTFQVVLKRKVNPIAMYVKKGPGKPPVFEINIGYDLEVGDWVIPYGKGKISDIVFNLNYKPVNPLEFTAILTVTFPNNGDGMIAFEAPIEKEQKSQFRSDYQAPEKGYIKSLIHNWIRKSGKPDVNTRKRTRNYYIRVRTQLDKDGKIVSAHYGKIYGDFMQFTHYLNPTPNDRNVEFDPQKNLIDTGFRGAAVHAP